MSLLSIALIFLLYLSDRQLISQFSRLIHRFGGGRNSLIIFWSLIFLPGTIIHELSHFFFAILTGARTGKIEVLPRLLEEDWENEENSAGVTLGYVQTQKLNPLQGLFIGLAPFIIGLVLLVWLSSLIQQSYLSATYSLLFFQGYLFFTISNSFFPSKSDIKHTLPMIFIFSLIMFSLWFLNVPLLTKPATSFFTLLKTINITLTLSIVVNLSITLIIFAIKKTRRI